MGIAVLTPGGPVRHLFRMPIGFVLANDQHSVNDVRDLQRHRWQAVRVDPHSSVASEGIPTLKYGPVKALMFYEELP